MIHPSEFNQPRRPARVEPLYPPRMKSGCIANGVLATVLIVAFIYGSLFL